MSTPGPIEQHVLDALHSHDPDGSGDLVRWSAIKSQVPGSYWQKQEAITALWQRGDIVIVKVGGSPLIGLPDEFDREIAPRLLTA